MENVENKVIDDEVKYKDEFKEGVIDIGMLKFSYFEVTREDIDPKNYFLVYNYCVILSSGDHKFMQSLTKIEQISINYYYEKGQPMITIYFENEDGTKFVPTF